MVFVGMLSVQATDALHHSQMSALDESRRALDKALDGQNSVTRAAFTCGTQMGKHKHHAAMMHVSSFTVECAAIVFLCNMFLLSCISLHAQIHCRHACSEFG